MRRITNIRLPKPIDDSSSNDFWWVLLDEDDVILSINPMEMGSALAGIDWGGDWLSPMGVDLQMNGGLGISFPELKHSQLKSLLKLLDRLWIDGVDEICPTFVSCEINGLRKALDVLREARNHPGPSRCRLLGAHLEGPFIAQSHRGAHSLSYTKQPSLSSLDSVINGFESEIALVTLAPELVGAKDLIRRLKNLGVVVSLGHTAATEKECFEAFSEGARMLTHGFNAMPGLGHKEPGPIGAAVQDERISIGLIADGVHVHPSIAVLIHRLVSERIVLVSDSLSPYGLEEGRYEWDKKTILVKDGTCRRIDGTLAGVTIPFLEGCKRLASWSKEPAACIYSATIAPRNVLDSFHDASYYLIGKSLRNLLRWEWNSTMSELIWYKAT